MSKTSLDEAVSTKQWPNLTVRDVAERCGVCRKTVYRHPERFGGRRVGGVWRFSEVGIEGALSGAQTEGKGARHE